MITQQASKNLAIASSILSMIITRGDEGDALCDALLIAKCTEQDYDWFIEQLNKLNNNLNDLINKLKQERDDQ